MRRKTHVKATFGGFVVLILLAGTAWACTPGCPIQIVGPALGPAGKTVEVQGDTHEVVSVQLRWNSADGPLLGTMAVPGDSNAKLSMKVTIPDVPPGVYAILAVPQPKPGLTNVATTGRAAFEVTQSRGSGKGSNVTSDRSSAVGKDLWTGFQDRGAFTLDQNGSSSEPRTHAGLLFGAALAGVGLVAAASAAGLMTARRKRSSNSRLSG